MARAIIMVIDGFGLGHAPDAEAFGDVSANTFGHLAEAFANEKQRQLNIPELAKLGLVNAGEAASSGTIPVEAANEINGAFGYAAERSTGKDTPSGHWEMAGVPVLFDWGYFTDKKRSFSEELVAKINQATGYNGILGNCHASGTDIIASLGEQHISSGLPICYTSADSVFQVAAHEQHFGLDNLYKYCETVRELLGDMNIGRVIARPFIGTCADDFVRTGNRCDYSILPPAKTLLDKIVANEGTVISVGKIADIFAHQGISIKTKATGLTALIDATIAHIEDAPASSLIFTNLVNFDQDYGHRRDPVGYGEALELLDARIQDIKNVMKDDDILFFTSDHGCDPTWKGNDHTREFVPVIAYHHRIKHVDLGQRSTFADLGQTIADLFDLTPMDYGKSFLPELGFK